jgi:hypothetical protein
MTAVFLGGPIMPVKYCYIILALAASLIALALIVLSGAFHQRAGAR